MLTSAQFKEVTKASGFRNAIKPLDAKLSAYKNPVMPISDYRDILIKLGEIRNLAGTYLREKPTSARAAGVQLLIKIADYEIEIFQFLSTSRNESKASNRGRLVLKALDLQKSAEVGWSDGDKYLSYLGEIIEKEWISLDSLLGFHKTTTEDGKAIVAGELGELADVAKRDTTPPLIRVILLEVTASRNVCQISPSICMSSLKYNVSRSAGDPKYTLSHNLKKGGYLRVGTLVHELTHLAVAESFGNTCIMFAIARDATPQQWIQLSQSRKRALGSLKELIEKDTYLSRDTFGMKGLKNEMISAIGYALGPKIGKYLIDFKDQIIAQQGADAHTTMADTINNNGIGSELVEYDSVVNQLLMFCWLNHLPEDNPVFVSVKQLAEEAMLRRVRATKPQIRARPLPRIPVEGTGGPKMAGGPKMVGGPAMVRRQ
jgi:hypothetical protein